MGRVRCLVHGRWLWVSTIFQFCRLFPYCHWGYPAIWNPFGRKLCSPLPFHNAIRVLDALAHVAFLLDTGLPFLAPGPDSPGEVVAKCCTRAFDGFVRIVA